MTFGLSKAKKVYFPHTNNLIIRLNIANCILRQVLVDPTTDVSILYAQASEEIRLLFLVLNLPHLALKSFNDDLSMVLRTIYLPVKLSNDTENYIYTEETFFVIELKSVYCSHEHGMVA